VTVYDGNFDLSFLRDGETVGSCGDGTGAIWIEQVLTPSCTHGMRVEVGDAVDRTTDGLVVAYRKPDSEPDWRARCLLAQSIVNQRATADGLSKDDAAAVAGALAGMWDRP
jgi:hypothetical protein